MSCQVCCGWQASCSLGLIPVSVIFVINSPAVPEPAGKRILYPPTLPVLCSSAISFRYSGAALAWAVALCWSRSGWISWGRPTR